MKVWTLQCGEWIVPVSPDSRKTLFLVRCDGLPVLNLAMPFKRQNVDS